MVVVMVKISAECSDRGSVLLKCFSERQESAKVGFVKFNEEICDGKLN